MTTIELIAVGVIITGSTLILGISALRIITALQGKTGNPTIAAVLDALKPYIYTAILAAEKTADDAFTTASITLEGTDKKAVADSVYALLPDPIMVGSIPVPTSLIKLLVSQESFENAIKAAYDTADAFILRNKAYLDKQVSDLLPPSTPVGSTSNSYSGIVYNMPTSGNITTISGSSPESQVTVAPPGSNG